MDGGETICGLLNKYTGPIDDFSLIMSWDFIEYEDDRQLTGKLAAVQP